MKVLKLFAQLAGYYVLLGVVVAMALWLVPGLNDYLPVGRVQTLISHAQSLHAGIPVDKSQLGLQMGHVDSLGGSLVWLISAILGALLVSLPVSWVYIHIRDPEQYDQSLIGTIVVLPVVVTSIVVLVQNSLALSFSLAGIAGVARYRNSMKSSGDLLFILLAIGIGLASGVGALELAAVTSVVFNLCFLLLWSTEYGESHTMKRYLSDYNPLNTPKPPGTVITETHTLVMEQDTRVSEIPDAPAPKDDPEPPKT
jgi:hypothetical protein